MDAAVALMVAAIVANLAAWGLNLFVIPTPGFTQMRRQMGQQDALVGLAATVAFWIVVSAVWLFLVLRMRAGRNGARLVLGVIGGLNGLVSVGGAALDLFSSPADFVADRLPGVAPDVLALGAAMLMFLPASNAYFAMTRWAEALRRRPTLIRPGRRGGE